jgi:hypothetical protein
MGEARGNYLKALDLCRNTVERNALLRRLQELAGAEDE